MPRLARPLKSPINATQNGAFTSGVLGAVSQPAVTSSLLSRTCQRVSTSIPRDLRSVTIVFAPGDEVQCAFKNFACPMCLPAASPGRMICAKRTLLLGERIAIVASYWEPYAAITACYLDQGNVPYPSTSAGTGSVYRGFPQFPAANTQLLRLGLQ